MVYTVSTRNYIGNHVTIVARGDEGDEIPVLNLMPGEVDFPGDVRKLAENLASILNGNPPLHDINVGAHKVFWQRTPQGMMLRVLETGDRS